MIRSFAHYIEVFLSVQICRMRLLQSIKEEAPETPEKKQTKISVPAFFPPANLNGGMVDSLYTRACQVQLEMLIVIRIDKLCSTGSSFSLPIQSFDSVTVS